MENCQNCGVAIGNLETPFVWREAIVCGACHSKLAGFPKPVEIPRRSVTPMVVCSLLFAAALSFGVWKWTHRNAEISGSAWVTRNSAESSLLRGIKVSVLQRRVSGSIVGQNLTLWANKYLALAKRERVDAQSWPYTGMEGAQEDTRQARKINETVAQLPAEVDVLAGLRMAKAVKFGHVGFYDDVVDAATVLGVAASADAKYRIPKVPNGDYYLHAQFASDSMFIEWMIPIEVRGQPLTVDLSNENAVVLENIRP